VRHVIYAQIRTNVVRVGLNFKPRTAVEIEVTYITSVVARIHCLLIILFVEDTIATTVFFIYVMFYQIDFFLFCTRRQCDTLLHNITLSYDGDDDVLFALTHAMANDDFGYAIQNTA